MTRTVNSLYRVLTCAAAAVVITVVMSVGLVQSTSAAPFHVTAVAI
jgi:hypothetical protein